MYVQMSKDAQFDVLVIGGGPAGLAAAVMAAECGRRVGIVDDNAALGGQIWRGEAQTAGSAAQNWAERMNAAGVELRCSTRVFHQPQAGALLCETPGGVCELQYSQLVIATGARERFLPFPGWTLPNVMGAGGLQAMVKSGLAIAGKRVVVAGSGPLLIAVAAYLRQHGAVVPFVCEQASWSSLARFGLSLLGQSGKLAEALRFRRQLQGVQFAAGSWVVEAKGKDVLEEVVISRGGKPQNIACDYLACGFHLAPNVELAAFLGCNININDGCVLVDDLQRTSVRGVFCAGEPTGIGGLELSLVEGKIAGFAAAAREVPRPLFAERSRMRRFAHRLNVAFALRPELKKLAQPETIVCRCEDVTCGRLSQHTTWREAKLHSRCGMGPCQGRVCGPGAEFLFGWKPDSVRPPIFPVAFESLARISEAQHEPVGPV